MGQILAFPCVTDGTRQIADGCPADPDSPSRRSSVIGSPTGSEDAMLYADAEALSSNAPHVPPKCVGRDDLDWAEAAKWGALPKGKMVKGKHCWGEPAAGTFNVRGANYLKDKKKFPSEASLCKLMAVDFIMGPKMVNMSQVAMRPGGPVEKLSTLADAPFCFIINFNFRYGENDGCMGLYWVRREDGSDDGASRLLDRLADPRMDSASGNAERATYVKVIPKITEGNTIIKNVVGGKPAIIGKKIPVKTFTGPGGGRFIEVDFNCAESTAGNTIINAVGGGLKGMVIDLAFVLESKTSETLPERVLGTVRLSRLDLTQVAKMSAEEWPQAFS